MLTEKEKEWLALRELRHFETGYYMSSFKHEGKTWYSFSVYTDWKAAAEFEARVAASIAQDAHNCALDEITAMHREGDKPQGWYILRDARLAVEQEMEGCTK